MESFESSKNNPDVLGTEEDQNRQVRDRLNAIHSKYREDKYESFAALQKIAYLENEIFDAQEFLIEIKKQGEFSENNPAVKEAQKIILDNTKHAKEIYASNPKIKTLFLEPRQKEHEEYQKTQKEKKELEQKLAKEKTELETFEKNLKYVLDSDRKEKDANQKLHYGDLIVLLNQAVQKNYLEKGKSDEEKVKKMIDNPKLKWRTLVIGNNAYILPSGESPEKTKIFNLLKDIRNRCASHNKERKQEEEKLKKGAVGVEILNEAMPEAEAGTAVFVSFNGPMENKEGGKNKKIFLKGSVRLELQEGKKGKYWLVVGTTGNFDMFFKKGTAIQPGMANAPQILRSLVSKKTESAK